jgi:hypothetical protein
MEITDDSHDGVSAPDSFHTHQTLHSSPSGTSPKIHEMQAPRDALGQAINLLYTEHDRHVVASQSFSLPPDILASDIQQGVSR